MFRMLPCMCCKIFGVCHKHNSLPLEPIQPSSPTTTKELHDLGHIRVILPVANLDLIVPNNNSFLGGSPGLAVIGGYSHSEGRGFESQCRKLDGNFFTLICY